MKKLLIVLSAFIVGGCAADGASFTSFSGPSKGNSGVYVYRVNQFVGGGVPFHVKIDDKLIGVLKNGGYLYSEVTAGTHFVSSQTEVLRTVKIDAVENQNTCIKLEPSIGILAARPNLSLVEKDTCAFEMTKTKLSN